MLTSSLLPISRPSVRAWATLKVRALSSLWSFCSCGKPVHRTLTSEQSQSLQSYRLQIIPCLWLWLRLCCILSLCSHWLYFSRRHSPRQEWCWRRSRWPHRLSDAFPVVIVVPLSPPLNNAALALIEQGILCHTSPWHHKASNARLKTGLCRLFPWPHQYGTPPPSPPTIFLSPILCSPHKQSPRYRNNCTVQTGRA